MINNLKCPFCGAELVSDPEYLDSEHFHCENEECIFPSSVELHSSVWQKMIDGKKAQGALNRAISEISELCFTVLYCSGEADNELELVRQHAEMVEEAKARIFSEITSITKQEE